MRHISDHVFPPSHIKEGDKHIQVMELFGPTIQGEGIMTGTVTHFLRTGGCPLRCSWCDSLFAVLPDQIKKHRTLMTTGEIIEAVNKLPYAPYITFTGGDPCIQDRLGDIIPAMNRAIMRVAVETQGMYFPEWLHKCDILTFSPKGPSSGNVVDPLPLADYLATLGRIRSQEVCIKIVVFDEEDFAYALSVYNVIPQELYDAFYFTAGTPLHPKPDDEDPDGQISRAAQKLDEVLINQQALAEQMLNCGTNFNDKVRLGCQQHVLLWPDKDKGV